MSLFPKKVEYHMVVKQLMSSLNKFSNQISPVLNQLPCGKKQS